MNTEVLCDEQHPRTIIHIDMDYYYAQVEEIRNPSLRSQPVGIQQKNIVVTCNYVARSFGVGKLMLITEAQKLCPKLVLVNGEDLTNYRRMSTQIFDVLQTFTPSVEKLGFDENFLDVTALVSQRLDDLHQQMENEPLQFEGFVSPDESAFWLCACGCHRRLWMGARLAKEIRDKLYTELGLTCCAGIAHNKLLAKLAGSQNKPNKQTALAPAAAVTFMSNLDSLRRIAGIGEKTEQILKELNVTNVQQLQETDVERLQSKMGFEMACKLKEMSFGRDASLVRPSAKPKTIGLEDSCKPISIRSDVENKYGLLLMRLVNQVAEDGRIPIAIKLIVRKFDAAKKTNHRETKRANIMPSFFKQLGDGKIIPSAGTHEKLLAIVMRMFDRCIDMKQSFNITLLGLAFCKFQERKMGSGSIANFLIKKSSVEVQSVTSLSHDCLEDQESSPPIIPLRATRAFQRISPQSPCSAMDIETDDSYASDDAEFSESEIEPSPKKSRMGLLIAKRRCLARTDPYDAASPSKLRVADLRLNSKDSERENSPSAPNSPLATSPSNPMSPLSPLLISPTTPNVLITTTPTVQSLAASLGTSPLLTIPKHTCALAKLMQVDQTAAVQNRIPAGAERLETSFLDDNCAKEHSSTASMCVDTDVSMPLPSPAGTFFTGTVNPIPASVDPNVFKELPIEVQNELLSSWKTTIVTPATPKTSRTSTASGPTASSSATANNTLHRYFLTNK